MIREWRCNVVDKKMPIQKDMTCKIKNMQYDLQKVKAGNNS